MDVNRNTQIVINDDLLRKIVYCIEKAIGDDLQQYLRENHRETNNAIILLRGDNINTNLLEFPQFYPQSFKPTASVINNFQKMPKI